MDDSAYYRSAIPEPRTVLGLPLRPFCLGHLIILTRFESPILLDPATAISSDLLFAVFVCSRSYEDCLEALSSGEVFAWVADWSRQLTRPTFLQKIGLRPASSIDWAAKFKSFAEYVAEASKHPTFSVEDNGRIRSLAQPLPAIVRTTLLAKTSLSDKEILNRPWGLALTEYLTIRAMEGVIQLTDSDAIEAARRAAEEYEAAMSDGTPSKN